MDIEQIQKINKLALDLMKQGLAADREEAVQQAERIFREQGGSGYSSIRNTMGDVQAEAKLTVQKAAASELSQDSVKEILEKNTTFLVKTIKEFQEKITSLESEMQVLKTRMNFQAPAQRAAEPRPAPQSSAPASSGSGGQSAAQAAAPNHPRSGSYTQQDVSIEKFFYMGKR